MLVIYILASAYICVAVFSVIMTCLESAKNPYGRKAYHGIGVLLCLVWPVMLIAILVTQTYMLFNGRRMSHSNS